MTHQHLKVFCIGMLCLAGWPGLARAQDDGGASMTVSNREGGGDDDIVFSMHDIASIRFDPCVEMIVRLNNGTEQHIDLITYGVLKFVPCDRNPLGGRMPQAATPNGPSSASSGLAISLFPNPTSSSLVIEIASDRHDQATVAVYDLAGNLVWAREAVEIGGGLVRVIWSGLNAAGGQVTSGTYVVRVTASGRESMQSVSVTK